MRTSIHQKIYRLKVKAFFVTQTNKNELFQVTEADISHASAATTSAEDVALVVSENKRRYLHCSRACFGVMNQRVAI